MQIKSILSLLIISSRDCHEADSRDTSPRHACLGEVSRKICLHDFAINNNGGSVPVIFISLGYVYHYLTNTMAKRQCLHEKANIFKKKVNKIKENDSKTV